MTAAGPGGGLESATGVLRVLVVEDDADDQAAIRRALEASPTSLQVSWAASLREAGDHLAARPYDVVLMDCGLPDSPGSSGATVAHLVARSGHARIVVLTGTPTDDAVRACYEAGADEVLTRAAEPSPPRLSIHLQGQALAAQRVRRAALGIAAAEAALLTRVAALEAVLATAPTLPGAAPASWWVTMRALPPVQQGALAVALVAALAQVVSELLRQLGPVLPR